MNGKIKKIEFLDENLNLISAIKAENGKLNTNDAKAIYSNIFPYTEAHITQLFDGRKIDYEISSPEFLNHIPANSKYVAVSEEIVLPKGWNAKYYVDKRNENPTESKKQISVFNEKGEEVLRYMPPIYFEKNNETDIKNPVGDYEIEQVGQILTIKTLVEADWLRSEGREFPVVIDPTVDVSPNNTTNWTRSADGGGSTYTDYVRFGHGGSSWYVAGMKFNTSSITSGSTVSGVTGYLYITQAYVKWGGTVQFAYSADPTTTSGSSLYSSVTGALSNATAMNSPNSAWKSIALNSTGVSHVQSNIAGTVILGLDPVTGYSSGQWYGAVNHTDNNRPYLAVTYTAPSGPPSCATPISPTNGATATGHSGNLEWNAPGATKYDVYFGTSSTPPLVSTDQTGTTYNMGTCLLPSTTYYWRIAPKNADGSATGCATWSFTTDNKLNIYKNDFETSSEGFIGTSGTSVDGWYANNISGTGNYYNRWTVGSGTYAINGMSVGVTAMNGGALAGSHFMYWEDMGTLYRWIYRPFDMTGLRDIELTFNWKCGGEVGNDFGTVATSINSGANWLTDDQGGINNNGEYSNSYSTRSQTIILSETRNNESNFQLAFKWNDLGLNNTSSYPSFVVDDIVMKACPYEGTIKSSLHAAGVFEWSPTGSTQTTLTINGSHQCAQFAWEQSTNGGSSWVAALGGSGANTQSFTTPNNLTENIWYRCKVYFGTGCTGVYQDNPFKIIFSVSCVSNVSPVNSATNVSPNTTLTWSAEQLATSYDVYFGTDNPPATMVINTSNTSYNVTNLENSTTYYWRIIPKNASSTASGCDVWQFTTEAAAPPVFHNFGGTEQITFNNSSIQTSNPKFRISHSSSASEYRIQINANVAFSGANIFDGTFSGTYVGNTPTNFECNTPTLADNTTYYARAQAKIGSSWSEWSLGTFSFTYKPSGVLEWHQTMEPQFETGLLDNVITKISPDLVTLPASSGAPTNPFTNPSFETSSGWTAYKTGGSVLETNISDGSNWKSQGTKAARMYMYGGYAMSSDVAIISQVVDLTDVEQIVFDAESHYGPNMFSSLANGGTLKLIIGGNSSNTTGTTYATINHCVNGSNSCSNETLNKTANINPVDRIPNQTVKFVWTGFTGGDLGGALVSFMVDNVRAGVPEVETGTITSTPINLSSFYEEDSWYEFSWNQTQNAGGIKFSIEKENGSNWDPVTDFTNFSSITTGDNSKDITDIASTERIRLKATFSRTGAKGTLPELNSWTVKAKKTTPLPVELLYFNVNCNGGDKEFTWETASEINSDYFEIMASGNAKDYTAVAKIRAAGNSSQNKKYTYTLRGQNDKTYFRLKQTDFDGKFEYFDPTSVNCNPSFSLQINIYPNPAQDELYCSIVTDKAMDIEIQIVNYLGQICYVKNHSIVEGRNTLDISPPYNSGIYLVKVISNSTVIETKKIIIQ